MEFEIVDISELEKLSSNLKIESDPFSSEKAKRALSKLKLLVERNPEQYEALNEELSTLKTPVKLALDHLVELEQEITGLSDKILSQQELAENYYQEVIDLTEEIEDLEEDYFSLSESNKKDDQMIETALQLLIEAKKYKLESVLENRPEDLEDYQENIESFYEQYEKFEKITENLKQMKGLVADDFKKLEDSKLESKIEAATTKTVRKKEKETKEKDSSLETRSFDAIIPSNVIKKNKYKKLLGK
ncbi:MAG: hypothetical protein ACK5LM_00855 [Lactovum sp.]